MRLQELILETFQADFATDLDEFDEVYNTDALRYRNQEEESSPDFSKGTPITKKPKPDTDEEIYTNDPHYREEQVQSPGYRGLQNVKKRSGHKEADPKTAGYSDEFISKDIEGVEHLDRFNQINR